MNESQKYDFIKSLVSEVRQKAIREVLKSFQNHPSGIGLTKEGQEFINSWGIDLSE